VTEILKDIAEFHSALFTPVLPEDSQANPQVYGAELAWWLCVELARNGIATSYPVGEDWGWLIEYFPASGSEFAVHCGNVGGERDHWQLSLRRHGRKMFGRDLPPWSEGEALVDGIKALLEGEPRIRDLHWQFDRASGA
jgi:hypothetical protein